MSSYLTSHYRGKYKILPEIDQTTNYFVLEKDGTICDNDCYIPCQKGSKIFYFGHYDDNKIAVWLTAYIPSIYFGNSVLSGLSEQSVEVRDLMRLDGEMIFNFRAKDIEVVAKMLKPFVRGSKQSLHSTKNLPKSNYVIPSAEIDEYKRTIAGINGNGYLLINRVTDRFLKNILQRNVRKVDKKYDYKEDIRRKCMTRKIKEYIHSMGFWDQYIKYLNKEIDKV